ncbi:transcriptional regulator [Thermoflexus sp.]|uniref:transcriptional regulator n=1 Tax=Thermoflexus sp. TaxID=1969742 RepID=UPI0035E3F4FC
MLRSLIARLTGRPNRLLAFDEVKEKLSLRGSVYRGLRRVPLDHIVGSVNRYQDFDRAFLPIRSHMADRWVAVGTILFQEASLPPVRLYQVGEAYFVLDGHHRISAARALGWTEIEAEVIEVRCRVPVGPDLRAEDLEILHEYEEFLERTHLDLLRPEADIRFTIAGGYHRLLEHIAVHRYFMGLEQGREIPEDEAVAHWYDTVYLPVVETVREHRLLEDFPGRTEADLYLWIMDHLYYLREIYGPTVDPETAALSYADQFAAHPIRRLVNELRRAIEAMGDLPPMEIEPKA